MALIRTKGEDHRGTYDDDIIPGKNKYLSDNGVTNIVTTDARTGNIKKDIQDATINKLKAGGAVECSFTWKPYNKNAGKLLNFFYTYVCYQRPLVLQRKKL